MSRPAYVVALSGGLGNQMFQYALGRSLAARHTAELRLDVRAFAADPLRSYSLGALATTAGIASAADLPPSGKWVNRVMRRMPDWLRDRHRITETAFSFDPKVLAVSPPAYVVGNWQSEKYFADIAEVVRQEFALRHELASARQAIAREISGTAAVSVHVRRGDYVSNPQTQAYHGSLDVDWYLAAMSTLRRRIDGLRFFVFSDDPQWARRNLATAPDIAVVEPPSDGRDWEDMHLMSLCRHHIIANSSFSWWGAWLNPRPDKQIVAPAVWFRNASHDTRDLIPSSWQRL